MWVKKKRRVISEINVTPLVDVLLVLLIIFMISAPMMTAGLEVKLPKAAGTQVAPSTEQIIVLLRTDGSIYLQNKPIKSESLALELKAMGKTVGTRDFNQKIYVKADQALNYGLVMRAVSAINQAGFTKIMLVTLAQKIDEKGDE